MTPLKGIKDPTREQGKRDSFEGNSHATSRTSEERGCLLFTSDSGNGGFGAALGCLCVMGFGKTWPFLGKTKIGSIMARTLYFSTPGRTRWSPTMERAVFSRGPAVTSNLEAGLEAFWGILWDAQGSGEVGRGQLEVQRCVKGLMERASGRKTSDTCPQKEALNSKQGYLCHGLHGPAPGHMSAHQAGPFPLPALDHKDQKSRLERAGRGHREDSRCPGAPAVA